jgi:hypothetical protein
VQAMVLLDDPIAGTPQYVLYLGRLALLYQSPKRLGADLFKIDLLSISIFNFVLFLVGNARKNRIFLGYQIVFSDR